MKYVILNKDKVNEVDFSKVGETSADTLRYKLDGSEFIVKYVGEKPSFINNEQEHSHSEILIITQNPANGWIDNEEEL